MHVETAYLHVYMWVFLTISSIVRNFIAEIYFILFKGNALLRLWAAHRQATPANDIGIPKEAVQLRATKPPLIIWAHLSYNGSRPVVGILRNLGNLKHNREPAGDVSSAPPTTHTHTLVHPDRSCVRVLTTSVRNYCTHCVIVLIYYV
jgi:hypothetical protein